MCFKSRAFSTPSIKTLSLSRVLTLKKVTSINTNLFTLHRFQDQDHGQGGPLHPPILHHHHRAQHCPDRGSRVALPEVTNQKSGILGATRTRVRVQVGVHLWNYLWTRSPSLDTSKLILSFHWSGTGIWIAADSELQNAVSSRHGSNIAYSIIASYSNIAINTTGVFIFGSFAIAKLSIFLGSAPSPRA